MKIVLFNKNKKFPLRLRVVWIEIRVELSWKHIIFKTTNICQVQVLVHTKS